MTRELASQSSPSVALAQEPASRRRMLAGLGAVGAAGAAAAVMPLVNGPAAPVAQADALAAPPEAGGGYQVTEHVRRYYQTTRV